MSHELVKAAVPNGVLFLSDAGGGTPPEPRRGAMVLATPTCIAVACKVDCEGPTEIRLDHVSSIDPGWPAAFDGVLQTPRRSVVVSTVEGKSLLRSGVGGSRIRVRVWLNHPTEPDRVLIGLG